MVLKSKASFANCLRSLPLFGEFYFPFQNYHTAGQTVTYNCYFETVLIGVMTNQSEVDGQWGNTDVLCSTDGSLIGDHKNMEAKKNKIIVAVLIKNIRFKVRGVEYYQVAQLLKMASRKSLKMTLKLISQPLLLPHLIEEFRTKNASP